ncbi:hypothetical protein EX895_005227 [Sporisorium graminicola]|uniref:Uncharacterized protein n=1 Tax=Sporisorium graminicola TaxID=280036 RepID=A0A4U7KPD1_9BASI|nr:hypothetical protein EX895_005227 [Sporisorium graminicola]TKY85687.1 hypothetical protein EX895_005227 [Sporisorium graminicola]
MNSSSLLKGKVFEQRQLLARVKQDLAHAWQVQRELEEVRKENSALKQDIQALRSLPVKIEAPSAFRRSTDRSRSRATELRSTNAALYMRI